MKRFLYIFVTLCLVAEREGFFENLYTTPLRWISTALLETKLFVIPVVDAIVLFILFASKPVARGSDSMVKAVYASMAAVAISAAWGVMRGGSAYQVQFQVHALIMSYVLFFAIRKVLQAPEDYVVLGKILVGVAVYRALSCLAFYFFILRPGVLQELPPTITSHDDSVIFAVGFALPVLYACIRPSPRSIRSALVICALIVVGIYLNNRRIAYVSMLGALVFVYAALPSSPLKSRINRKLLPLAPLLAIYVAVGWGRTEGIFKPLASITSVNSSETDLSAKSRDNENMGLIVTFGQSRWMGTGWGHEYIEVDDTLAPKSFLQYKYLPHNSVLGLLAFSGILCFTGTWMVFPICSLLAARAIKQTRSPTVRLLGMGTFCQVVVCLMQAWGDMGIISYVPTFVMATGFACASHLPAFEAMAMPAPLRAAMPLGSKRPSARAVSRNPRSSPSA
ncbi:MAG TPA: O-antigen ligase family protein [Polyangiales bacterium]|nr:O-antigen ligase family protein [Polyangiales bacterium]